MLILLSPAKNLSLDIRLADDKHTNPRLLEQAKELMRRLREHSPDQLMALMSISKKLADLNYQRNLDWQDHPDHKVGKPALATFRGDVYLGLKAWEMDQDQLKWAQNHLRILSGLYGVLRPMDLIQPYRLEMGSPIKLDKTLGLYDFWGDKPTALLNKDIEQLNTKRPSVILNLASNEYFAVVRPKLLKARIITPKFLEWRKGRFRFISFSAKRARGMMANFIIKNQTTDLEDIKAFNYEGYSFNAALAAERKNEWCFTRNQKEQPIN